jgi:hypothetical protein
VETAPGEETELLSAGFAEISRTLQLDTALNTGYSGAPALTADGLFTGLVVYPGNSSPDVGQHAAVLPLSHINSILAQLEAGNNLNWIGLNAGPISAASAEQIGIEAAPGLFVYAVDFRGPGGQADVRNGDFITQIGGQDVTGADGLDIYCSVLRGMSDEEVLDIVVMRGGNRYLGQIYGDPLTEEIVVVDTLPEGTTDTQPPAGDAQSTLLAIMQNTDSELRNVGGTIDSLANNGCLNPPLLAASSEGGPGNTEPEAETLAHPGCIHSIIDCELILASYGRITNPATVDLTNADQALINANNNHQAAIATFAQGASSLIEACRSFVADPNLTVGPLAFGLARQGITDALAILSPAIQQLLGGG